MATSLREPVAGNEGAGGAGGSSESGPGGFYGEPAPAAFALPFQGWLLLADAVAESTPQTADVMTAAAYLAQSALEERLPELIDEIRDVLTGSGFASGAVEGLRSALLSNRLAFSLEAVVDELAGIYADLGEENHLRSGDSPLQLADAAIDAFLDTELAGPDARTVYTDMAAQVKQQYRKPRWWASCSLDLPSVLDQPPIHCARRGFRRGSDRLVAVEWTYRMRALTGFDGNVTGQGPVGTVAAGGGYRDSIDELRPKYYLDTLLAPSTGLAFGLSLSEGRGWRWADKVARALDRQRTNIAGKVGQHVQDARAKIDTLLTAAQIPAYVIHPVIGLMVSAAHVLVDFISNFLVKSLRTVNLTSWAIWHTAVMGRARVPISVFTLSSPDRDNPELHYIRSGQDGFTASDDYGAYEGYMDQARFMIGTSEPPDAEFDPGFFDLAERTRRPLTWLDPMRPNGGFRILVPHRAPGSKASYASALRVDVGLEEMPDVYSI